VDCAFHLATDVMLNRSRSRGAFCVRVLPSSAPLKKGEGGAGRRGPRGPAGLSLSRSAGGAMLLEQAPLGLVIAASPFEALFRAAGLTFQAPALARPQSLSTAAGTCRRNRGWVPQKRRLPWSPVARGSARRDRSASAVARWVCVLHPFATTAPDPHRRTPPEGAPRGSRQPASMREDVAESGSKIVRNVISVNIKETILTYPSTAGCRSRH
jgi:hypothetical protein